jgi:hypothetical protein
MLAKDLTFLEHGKYGMFFSTVDDANDAGLIFFMCTLPFKGV